MSVCVCVCVCVCVHGSSATNKLFLFQHTACVTVVNVSSSRTTLRS